MMQNRKEEDTKIRIQIALGKTFEQVASEFNIPLSRYRKIPRIYQRKAIVNLLHQYDNEKIAKIAQIPVEIVERIREEQKQKEATLRIYSALGTLHEQIAEELNIAVSTVSGRKKEIKNLYSREMIINLLKSHDDTEIAELAQIPIEIVQQVRQETEKEDRFLRGLIAMDTSEAEIARRLNLTSKNLIESRKARLGKVYTKKDIEDLLEENSNQKIAQIAQISENIVSEIRIAKKIGGTWYEMNTTELGDSIQEKKIRNLVALGHSNAEIALLYHYKELSIRNIKFSFGMYSRVQINNLLDFYTDEEIASIANISFLTVKKIREEERNHNGKKYHIKNSEMEREIRNLIAQNVTLEDIALMLDVDVGTIKYIKAQLGIYSRIQIAKLLEIKDDEEIANITKVDLDVVAKIREEEKEKGVQKKQEEERKSQDKLAKKEEKQQREENLRIAFAEGKPYSQIMHEFNYASIRSVSGTKTAKGILGKREIVSLINNNHTSEQIAEVAQIPIEVIIKIREKVKEEEERFKELNRKKEKVRKLKKEISSVKQKQLRLFLAEGKTHAQIAEELHYKSKRSIERLKQYYNILGRRQISDLMDSDKTNEQIAQIAQIPMKLVIEIREEKHRINQALKKDCKTSLEQLNQRIKTLKEGNVSRKTQEGIEKQISKVLRNYQSFLTEVDYSFIAYVYLKIGMKEQCQEIAQNYLSIENFSMEEIIRKIDRILEAERFRKETSIVLITPDRYKEIEER